MNLKISKTGSSPNPSYKVTFNNLGPKTLIYRLRQTDQGWRVSDIIDGKTSLKALLRGRSD
ncbi:MAG TPA: hypothetical protein VJ302_25260 [Blastocatellia bacterium]|nr:hypothetical protein [Blastocatellia bacterium]